MSQPKVRIYRDCDLVYAAEARCPCGAGMAYVRGGTDEPGGGRYWDCADILTGRAVDSGKPGSVMHTGRAPFVFYEIKSEGQPSACGLTTRPAGSKPALRARIWDKVCDVRNAVTETVEAIWDRE